MGPSRIIFYHSLFLLLSLFFRGFNNRPHNGLQYENPEQVKHWQTHMPYVKYRLPEEHRGVDAEQPERHAEIGEHLHPHKPRGPIVRVLTLKIKKTRVVKDPFEKERSSFNYLFINNFVPTKLKILYRSCHLVLERILVYYLYAKQSD